jgi:MFS transporter, ACS family, tartrate transporter
MLLYLTYWFPQKDRARAVGFYLSGMPIATILGAPMSGLILDHVHWAGLSSWRWLLILEGAPAVVLGALTYFLLPDRPEQAHFLAAEERSWLCATLRAEEKAAQVTGSRTAVSALKSPRVWVLVGVYFGILTGLYASNFFAPQLVKAVAHGISNSRAGFLVMIPSVFGFAAMVVIAKRSDRIGERRFHVAIPIIAAGMSLVLLSVTTSLVLTLVLLCVSGIVDGC